MSDILFSDYPWFYDWEAKTGKSIAHLILEEENSLLHAYRRELEQEANLIRTPTNYCNRSYLERIDLEEKVEAVHNISVSAGMTAITNTKKDALLCGVVGPILNADQFLREEEIAYMVGEPTVYLIDKGVDCIQLEGFTDPTHFKIALQTIRQVNSVPVPISAFYRINELHGLEIMPEIFRVANLMEIEMVGFELTLEEAASLGEPLSTEEMAIGFQIHKRSDEEWESANVEKALTNLLRWAPSMLSVGVGVTVEEWAALKGKMTELMDAAK